MKRLLPLLVLILIAAPGLLAQGTYSYSSSGDHAEVGVFGNFFRLNDANIDFAGLGARLSINANPYIQLEAESAYDFRQAFTETTSNGVGGVTVTNSNVRVLHLMVGPKVQSNKGPVRLFLTAKGGFINFMFSNAPANFNTVGNAFANLRTNNMMATFYPGAGAEAFWGPIGFRLDAGDEIYFNNGAHNNLRISFGPTIRF
jgi:hypothetical protein